MIRAEKYRDGSGNMALIYETGLYAGEVMGYLHFCFDGEYALELLAGECLTLEGVKDIVKLMEEANSGIN